ncbi:hypothetical protein DFH07DRAFT_695533, partial [Mycena maculata]
FLSAVKKGYKSDNLFKKIVVKPADFKAFEVRDQIIYCRTRGNEEVMCLPDLKLGEQS